LSNAYGVVGGCVYAVKEVIFRSPLIKHGRTVAGDQAASGHMRAMARQAWDNGLFFFYVRIPEPLNPIERGQE
jgi:hypothetical protein